MNNGILLELLAELFQSIAGDGTTKVTRRRVFQLGKGDVAEVDILLEGRFGSSRMMVAIECRDRADKQGKDWIQQIVGKRDDLRSVGIRHWIAVSKSGFTEPAKALAKRCGIELLVPLRVTPADTESPGPHSLLNFQLHRSSWKLSEETAVIGHDDEAIADRVQQSASSGGLAEALVESADGHVPFPTFVIQQAEAAHRQEGHSGSIEGSRPVRVVLSDLQVRHHDQPFTLVRYEAIAEPVSEVIRGNCSLLTFSDPDLLEFVGLIGVNEFELDGERVYLLMGFKPGFPSKLVGHARTSDGVPIRGWRVQLDERQIQAAGFQSRPPQGVGSALLKQLLRGRG